MSNSKAKDLLIRKLPKPLAVLLARPDFGTLLAGQGRLDQGAALQLNSQSIAQRALYLLCAGYTSVTSSARSGSYRFDISLLTQGLEPGSDMIKAIQIQTIPGEIKRLLYAGAGEFAALIPDGKMDPWTEYVLADAGAAPRAIYLIYVALAGLLGGTSNPAGGVDKRTEPVRQPERADTVQEGSLPSPDRSAEISQQPGELHTAGPSSLLSQDDPLWSLFNKGA